MRILRIVFGYRRATLSAIKPAVFSHVPDLCAPLPRKSRRVWTKDCIRLGIMPGRVFIEPRLYQTGRFPGAHNSRTWEKSSIFVAEAHASRGLRSAGRRLPRKHPCPNAGRPPDGGRRNMRGCRLRLTAAAAARSARRSEPRPCGSGQRPPTWPSRDQPCRLGADDRRTSRSCRPADPAWDTCSWRSRP